MSSELPATTETKGSTEDLTNFSMFLLRVTSGTNSTSRFTNKDENSVSVLFSRAEKADIVKQQRQKRQKEQTEERRKKTTEMDEKKRRLAELKEKQLKIVKNNVKKARLKRDTQKKKESDAEAEQKNEPCGTENLDVPETNVEPVQFLDLVPQMKSDIELHESIEKTHEKKDSLIIRLNDVIACKKTEEEEEIENMVSNVQEEMKELNIFLDKAQDSSTTEIKLRNVRKLHPNITQRVRAQTAAPEVVPLNDNMKSPVQHTERKNSQFNSIKDPDKNLQTFRNNNNSVSFAEDPLVEKVKRTLEDINLLRSENYKEFLSPRGTFKRHNNEITDCIPSKRQNNKIEESIPSKRQNNEIGSFIVSKPVLEPTETRKEQEAAAIKIQTAFRNYRSRKGKKINGHGIEKQIFTRTERKPEIKSSNIQIHNVKKQADKNWTAAKYPSFTELRRDLETYSKWLPMLVQPSGYSMMTAIERSLLAKTGSREPYWLQTNHENTNRWSDMKNELGQTVPIIDASKQKPRKGMTVRQYLRSSKLTNDDLQSFLTSDEESTREDLTSSGTDTDRSRHRLRKQMNFKLQKVLPDRVKHGNWTQSETRFLQKHQTMKCRKKLIELSGKENIEINIRPSTAIETLSHGNSATTKKIKQKNYDLVAPNVELKRRNIRYKNIPTVDKEKEENSDSNTWNSHLTFQQLVELRKEERSRGIPLDLSSHVNDPNTWESHVTQRQKVSEEPSVGEPEMKRMPEISDQGQGIVNMRHKKRHDQKLSMSSEEGGDVGYSGKEIGIETKSDTSTIQEISPSSKARKHRRNVSHILHDGTTSVRDRKGERGSADEPLHSGGRSDDAVSSGRIFHPTALHLQFQAEMNRLESIEQSSKHLTALEDIVIKNMKMKQDNRRNFDNLEDKQIEAKPLTVESCAQTIDLVVPNLMLATERKDKESTGQLSIQKLIFDTYKPATTQRTEICQQTEQLIDSNSEQSASGVSKSMYVSHDELRGMNYDRSLSRPVAHIDKRDIMTTPYTEIQPLVCPNEESHAGAISTVRPVYQDDCREINLGEILSSHKETAKSLNIPKLLQESEQTRKTVAHAMAMGAVERSVKREEEKDKINRKHKLWSIEHLKHMNEMAREDNQLFEQSLLGRTSFFSTQAFVHSSLFLPRTIENQQTQTVNETVNDATNELVAAQDDAGRWFSGTQSILQQQHQERFANINFSRGLDMPLEPLARITEIEIEARDSTNNEDKQNIPSEQSNDGTSDMISEEDASVLKTEDGGVLDLDLSCSNFSDVSAVTVERSSKIIKIMDSIQKFDKLIDEEKENTQKQLILLNERFVHMRERTKTEIKLLRVKIRELKEKGQENQILSLKAKRNSLLLSLEEAKKRTLEESDKLRKATAERKKTLRQQKGILQSFLKSIQSKEFSVQEFQEQRRETDLCESQHQPRVPSVVDKEESSLPSSEVEKSLHELPKLESIQLSESITESQNIVLDEAKVSPSVGISPKEDTTTQKSHEFSDSFVDTESLSRRDSHSIVSGLEDKMKTVTDLLQKKKNEVENVRKDKKKTKWKVLEHTMLNHIQTFQDYLDSLKRELEDIMDSSIADVTLQSEEVEKEHGKHITESSDPTRGETYKDNEILVHDEVGANSNLTSESKILKSRQSSDEYHIQTQFDETSLLQEEHITSGAVTMVFSPHSISIKNPALDVSNRELLKGDESEIPSEIETMKNDIEEKSGITTDIKEVSEISEHVEKSQIVTEIDEKSDLITWSEDDSKMIPDPEGNAHTVTEIVTVRVPEENIRTATPSEYSNIITEVPEKSHGSIEIEEEFEIDTKKSEMAKINIKEKGKSDLVNDEEKSELSTQRSDIRIEEEQYTMSVEDEAISEINTEESKKSEINTALSENSEIKTGEDEKYEFKLDVYEKSEENSEISKSEIFTDEEENFHVSIEAEIKSDSKEEIETEEDSVISDGGKASISLEASAKEHDSSELVYELDDIEEGLDATESEKEKFELEDVKEAIEISTGKESTLSEELQKSIQDSTIDVQGISNVTPELQSEPATPLSKGSSFEEPEEHIEVEESVKEEFSSNIEQSEKIKSSFSESLGANQRHSEGKIIMPDETHSPTGPNEVATEHDRTETEHKIDKSEDVSSNIVSNIIEEVSNKTKDEYSSDSDSVMKQKLKLLSQKTDKITDAILKKILYESFMPLNKIPIDTISDHYCKADSFTTENDTNESKKDSVLNETAIKDREESNNFVNKLKKNADRVDSITNVIFEELLRDSAKIAYKNKNNIIYSKVIGDSSTESSSSENEEASSHRAATGIKPTPTPIQTDFDVRKRVHEILAESNASLSSPREKTRPQDFMVTTYDVLSPEDTPSDTSLPGSPTKLDLLASSIPEGSDAHLNLLELRQSADGDQAVSDAFSQEWFEDDFGLSTSTTRKEAEELRLQQLQIEQEIQELEQAQEQLPYFYFREIPNKPPPPYTPPGQSPPGGTPQSSSPPSKHDSTTEEEMQFIPCTSEELTTISMEVTDYYFNIIANGGDIRNSEPPPGFCIDVEPSDVNDIKTSSRQMFKKLIFELTRDFIKEAYGLEEDAPTVPWEWSAYLSKRRKPPPQSKEMLQDIVNRKVIEHFDSILKAHKEKLITRWTRKKRDFVDEILVKESHHEEADWTNYEEDEAFVKNDTTKQILEKLLDETVQLLSCILNRKKLYAAAL